jgi:D-proline reductase (dithiol) PrdB
VSGFGDLANRAWVQAFKHLPWLAERWAARHRFIEGADIPWVPMRTPVREAVIALVTTAGVHLKIQPAFDMRDPDGDPSFRAIPSGTAHQEATITHKYYDHSAADRDLNVVLPLDRLRELAADGRIGRLAAHAYSFMGHIEGRHLQTLLAESAPAVARRLQDDGAEAVLLTPA